jgi:hypothetical protein
MTTPTRVHVSELRLGDVILRGKDSLTVSSVYPVSPISRIVAYEVSYMGLMPDERFNPSARVTRVYREESND